MRTVLSWIKSHGAVHLAIIAVFVIPMVWLLTVVPTLKAPFVSDLRLGFDRLEMLTVDYRMQYGRKAEADPNLVFFAIDPASINLDVFDQTEIQSSPALSEMKLGFPYPRDVYAQACDRLFSAGAKVVAFDLIFRATTPTDPAFQQALNKYRNQVVIGLNFSDDGSSYELPSPSLLPSQDPLDDRLGYFNFWKDPIDVLLRGALYRNNNDHMQGHAGSDKLPKLYSVAARVVQKAGHADLVPDDFQPRMLRFAAGFPTFSFYKLFYSKNWDNDFKHGDFFRNKIVIIGPEGDWSKDTFSTPLGILSGAEMHLQAVNDLLQNDFLAPASDGFSISIVLVAAIIALALATFIHSVGLRFGVALALLAGYAGLVMWDYNGSGWLLPVVAPTFVFIGSVGVGFVYDFVVSQLERYRLRLTFERYNSKNVVKYLLAHPDSYKEMLVGTRREVSVLFSDIRGFTTIVETAADSRELVRKLNEYLTAMVDCVIKQDGNLEKFMGDGIMAAWGNTPYSSGPKDDAIRAVRAALAMTVELRRLNAKWLSEGRSEWRIGIGVNHGSVIVGDMGSPDHKEFAMVGDPVNLGSRLEGLTKEYRVQIMIGEMAAELIRDVFYLRSVDLVKVKGKNQAVKAFTVLGEKKDGLSPESEKFLQLHEEAMAAFRGRDFERARKLFQQALQIEPGDYLAGEFLRSATRYADEPPPADWDGARVMTEK